VRCLQWNGLSCGDAAGTARPQIYPLRCEAYDGKGKFADPRIAVKRDVYRAHEYCEACSSWPKICCALNSARTEAAWNSSVLDSADAEIVVSYLGLPMLPERTLPTTVATARGASEMKP
jgi:hypothetical protein